jgi:DNA-binding CsgD family transcriptional regulator/tetratricopeptide (TPR) repeat protein
VIAAPATWTAAYEQLRAADETHPLDPERLEQLAIAAHCLGKSEESTAAWARAYDGYLAGGDVERAALAAAWCSFGLQTRGEVARGGGWLSRARSLCDEHDLDCEAKWFALGQMAAGVMFSGDYSTALPMFEETGRLAERARDPNGMALSRLGRSQCLHHLGRSPEAMQLLDELLVLLSNDALSPLVAGLAFCGAIECCHRSLDVRRAHEWTTALSRWCDRQPDLVPYRGDCLVHRAEILALRGAWPEAYGEAERARAWLDEAAVAGPLGNVYYQFGELHRLRGEYAEAETAYKQASQYGREVQPGLGLLRLAQGHVESATAAIRRALGEASPGAGRAEMLAAQVEVALAAGDLTTARTAADELSDIAAQVDAVLLRAKAMHAAGAVRLAEGDARTAFTQLRAAWSLWQELDAPYESARVRVLIGAACRAVGDDETAEMEFDAARWVFTELGAAPDLERLQKLSAGTPAPPPGGLTLREVQVLRLVAAGKSNRVIADELFLSEKTVHRHVSNIFTKLDVGSRSAATAYAFQHDLV